MSEIRKMRAAVLLLGCLLLTGMFAGCGKKEETPANTVSVYYINKEETKITAVEKEPEGDTLSKQAEGKSGRAVFALTDQRFYDQQLECQRRSAGAGHECGI